jgi:hypothetical protein
MSRLAIALVLPLLAALSAAPAAWAVNFASLSAQASSPGGLTFERARAGIPGLLRPTFDAADRNGDGVIDAREFPTFQSLVNARIRMR